ncbi:MAG TPA: S9 family peptidase [Thermoanaerobaculia bacterium]
MKRLALLLLLATPLLAQKKALTLEALYDPKTMTRFGGSIQRDFEWIDDTTFLWPFMDPDGSVIEWRVFDVTSGKERSLFDRAKLQKAVEAVGLNADAAKEIATAKELEFDAKKSAIVFEAGDDLYLFSLRTGTATRLTSAPGEEEEPSFSPDGQKVAFVRANDLYVADLNGRERRITTDGDDDTLNGKLDYVYQEEVYGRGIFKGYWWSPDSSRIAFLQLDERLVPKYTIVDDLERHPDVKVFHYPKAGDPNPRAALKIAPAGGGKIADVDNERYTSGEFLIVDVTWADDGKTVTYQVQNREQSWLDLVSATPDGKSRTLLRETTKAWVDAHGAPVWLEDGSFLWQSERTGWRHLYHYRGDGTLIGPVTSGEWEVRDVAGVDGRTVYFAGTERSPIGVDVYRIQLDGSGLKRLSSAPGTHAAKFNRKLTHYVDKWSDIRTPDQIRLHRNDGREVFVVEANATAHDYDIPRVELMQVKTRDGFPMEAILIKPPDFDPAKKYPVYQLLYGGPHAPRVANKWSGQGLQSLLFLQFLAQQGIVGWVCDNRTASGKGAVSAWPAYKNLGESELRDIEDGVSWLKSQPWVDVNRIAIFGWSYGGFMVAYAMTHSKSFAAGISGAPVTDWRNYDSIYTERLMLMPQNNPEGYKKSAPRLAAKDLHGRLLLIHGATDDNVHPQNSMQFARDLQQAGIEFEMMMYPRTRHSVTDKKTLLHIQKTVFDFLKRQLLE